jgi:iron complex transport system substrate-binding protein
VPRVGGYSRIDLEAVAALKPDLVLAWESGNNMPQVSKLKALGLTVYVSQPNKMENVADQLERLGQLAGSEAAANAGRRALPPAPRSPAQGQCRQAEGAHLLPDLENAADDRRRPADHQRRHHPVRRRKRLRPPRQDGADGERRGRARSRPEAIVATGMGDAKPEWLKDWDKWTQMTAVKRNNLFHINPDIMQRHTPRILDGAEKLCAHLDVARSHRPAHKPCHACPNVSSA